MPRGRAALTEKEERILVQAQLMGLSTASMVKIGNRLRALEQEREEIERVNETCQGFTWAEKQSADLLTVTRADGTVFEAVRGTKGRSQWNQFSWSYTIKVSKPGTRFKTRTYKDRSLNCDYEWKKRLMPAQSKELYSLIRWVKNGMPWDHPDE